MSIGKISSKSAKDYYYEKDPVFNENEEGENLEWHGKQADMLGLENGEVTQKEFINLLSGKSPDGETQLLDREKTIQSGQENAVFDMPLSAPKSVSLVALGDDGDTRLIDAHDQAVEATIKFMEDNYAKTRGYVEQEDGSKKRETYDTGNLLIATAKHSVARPTADDPEPNAHLHTHTIVFNQTYDKKTDSFKALAAKDLFSAQKEINQVYTSNLAKNVKELGYGIEDNGRGSFDLKGVSEEVINKFSSRRNEVEAQMEAHGATTDKEKAHISSTMKSEKVDMSKEELLQSWDRKAEEIGTSIKELKENALETNNEKNFESAKEVLEVAANHLTKNDSHFTEKTLLKAADSISLGEYTHEELKVELDNVKKIGQKDPENLKLLGENDKGEKVFTTKEMYTIEKENEKLIKELGSNNKGAVMSKEEAESGIKSFEDKNFKLTEGQREAAIGILTSKESVISIQGDAGTGKSTMLAAVNHALEHNDNKSKFSVAAPTNKAVSGAVEASKTESGKSFEGSTVHKLVNQQESNATKYAINNVKSSSKKIEDAHLSTGNKAFSSDKNLVGVKKRGAGSRSFEMKFKGLQASSSSTHRIGGTTHITKSTKINKGEYKGSIKKETTSISAGGSSIKYQQDIKLNNGERYKQTVETFNPIKLGGRGGSPLAKIGSKVIGSTTRTIENEKGNSIEKDKNFAGLNFKSKNVRSENMDQTKHKVSLAGLVSAEQNVVSSKFKNGGGRDIDTKTFGLLGMKIKSSVETTYDKNGDITSKVATKEKTFLGLTVGRSTSIDKSGDLREIEYNKAGSKVLDNSVKVVKEEKVDLKDKGFEKKVEDSVKIKDSEKVLIIDESSMLSAKDVNTLLKNTKEEGVKVAFMGDTKQLNSIGAGNAFNQIQDNTKTFEMNEGQRQRNDIQKDITNPAAAKDIAKSLDNLEKSGNFKEVKDFEGRIKEVVNNVVAKQEVEITNMKGEQETTKIDYKNTIALAATNKENQAINAGVRDELKKQGAITNEVKNVTINVNKNMDAIKQSSAANYEKGDKITTFDKVKGMSRGAEYKIVDTDRSKNTLTLKSVEPDKKTGEHKFSTVKAKDIAGKITIKEEQKRDFGVGDKIVINETNKDAKVTNSDAGIITKMDTKNKIATVDFGDKKQDIDLNKFKGLDHGYSVTNHKAQGVSIDKVVALVDSKNKQMNSSQSYYVSMSRQKAESVLVTDNKEAIKNQVNKEIVNKSTLDDLKKDTTKIEQKEVSKELKNDIKEAINNKELERESGRKIDYSAAMEAANKAGLERNTAKESGDTDKYKDKQVEFMNQQVVARNGYSEDRVKDFADKQVESGKMSKEAANQFVENSNENAKKLEEVGILESKGNGDYKFVDSKAKEILHDNADKSKEEIGQKNLEAFKAVDKEVEKVADIKEEPRVEEKGLSKNSLNDLEELEKQADKAAEKQEIKEEKSSEKAVEKGESGEIEKEVKSTKNR